MKILPNQHPTETTLLLLLEGELSEQAIKDVQAHLNLCWDCRARAHELQEGIFAFVEYTEKSLLPNIGPPPGGWRGFAPLLDQAERMSAEQHRPLPLFSRVLRPIFTFGTAAAALVTILLFVWPVGAPPALSAGDFLQHARNSGRPRQTRVRIRVDGRLLGREESQIRPVLEKANFDWSDPLNASNYSAWHDSLRARTDRITKSDRALTLVTATQESPIRVASLSVDAQDWHPTGESFEFENGTKVDIAEAPLDPVHTSLPTKPKSVTLRNALEQRELLAIEVEARAAMHALNLDLDESWEIQLSPEGIVLAGKLSTAEKVASAHNVLARIANLTDRLEATAAGASDLLPAGDGAAETIAAVPGESVLAEKLKAVFPDATARTAYVNAVLAASEDELVRILALKRVSDRYTAAVIAELDETSRAKLQAIVDDHLLGLRKGSGALLDLIQKLGGSSSPGTNDSLRSHSWREKVDEALAVMRGIDRSCTRLFAGSQDRADGSQTAELLYQQSLVLRGILSLPYQL